MQTRPTTTSAVSTRTHRQDRLSSDRSPGAACVDPGFCFMGFMEETATRIYLDADNNSTINDDDLRIVFDDFLDFGGDFYTFSGSATIDLSSANHNFGQFNIGTYESNGDTLIVQYSSVPDTGSTAALLGAGLAALAFARRKLG